MKVGTEDTEVCVLPPMNLLIRKDIEQVYGTLTLMELAFQDLKMLNGMTR